MSKKKRKTQENTPWNTCAWCQKRIPDNSEVLALKARLRREIDLTDKEGTCIPMVSVLDGRVVPAIVTVTGSEAKKEGCDLVFTACSQECAESLRDHLRDEKEFLDALNIMDRTSEESQK